MNKLTESKAGQGHRENRVGQRRCCWPAVGILMPAVVFVGAGCIERTVSINTEPENAVVFLNDQEVGKSPVKVPFTWYGDYDIIIRKPGYKTVQTHHNIKTPWYALPGIDIFTECLVPFTVHDDRVLDTFILETAQVPANDAVLDAAAEMRQRAILGADGS